MLISTFKVLPAAGRARGTAGSGEQAGDAHPEANISHFQLNIYNGVSCPDASAGGPRLAGWVEVIFAHT